MPGGLRGVTVLRDYTEATVLGHALTAAQVMILTEDGRNRLDGVRAAVRRGDGVYDSSLYTVPVVSWGGDGRALNGLVQRGLAVCERGSAYEYRGKRGMVRYDTRQYVLTDEGVRVRAALAWGTDLGQAVMRRIVTDALGVAGDG